MSSWSSLPACSTHLDRGEPSVFMTFPNHLVAPNQIPPPSIVLTTKLCTTHLLSSSDARRVLNSRGKFHSFGRCQYSSWPKIRNFVKINGSLLLFRANSLLHYPNPDVSSLPRILQLAQLCIQVSDFHSASWYTEYMTEFRFLGPRDIAVANFRLPSFWNSSVKRKTFLCVALKLLPVPPLQAPKMGWRTSETPQRLRVPLATAAEHRAERKQQTSRTVVFSGKPPALLPIFPVIHWHEGPRWKLSFSTRCTKNLCLD